MATRVSAWLLVFLSVLRAADYSVGCGGVVSGYLGYSSSVTIEFVNSNTQNVLFTNCDSTFDTTLYLYDSTGSAIQYQSTNSCDGDDCFDSSYTCQYGTRETFTMSPLSVGTYELVLGPFSSAYQYNGYWEVEVRCGSSLVTTSDPSSTVKVGSYCNSHDDCWSDSMTLFCSSYLYQCRSCSSCTFCWSGVGDSCGECGNSYPVYESSSCGDSTPSPTSITTTSYPSSWWSPTSSSSWSSSSSSSSSGGSSGVWYILGVILIFVGGILRCFKPCQNQPNKSDSQNTPQAQPVSACSTAKVSTAPVPGPVADPQPAPTVQYVVVQPVMGLDTTSEEGVSVNVMPAAQPSTQTQLNGDAATIGAPAPLWPNQEPGSGLSTDEVPTAVYEEAPPPAYVEVDAPPAYADVAYQ